VSSVVEAGERIRLQGFVGGSVVELLGGAEQILCAPRAHGPFAATLAEDEGRTTKQQAQLGDCCFSATIAVDVRTAGEQAAMVVPQRENWQQQDRESTALDPVVKTKSRSESAFLRDEHACLHLQLKQFKLESARLREQLQQLEETAASVECKLMAPDACESEALEHEHEEKETYAPHRACVPDVPDEVLPPPIDVGRVSEMPVNLAIPMARAQDPSAAVVSNPSTPDPHRNLASSEKSPAPVETDLLVKGMVNRSESEIEPTQTQGVSVLVKRVGMMHGQLHVEVTVNGLIGEMERCQVELDELRLKYADKEKQAQDLESEFVARDAQMENLFSLTTEECVAIKQLVQKRQVDQAEAVQRTSLLRLFAQSGWAEASVPLPLSFALGYQNRIALLFPSSGAAKRNHMVLQASRETRSASQVHMLNQAEGIIGKAELGRLMQGPCDMLQDAGLAVFLASLCRIADLLEQRSDAVLMPWAVAGIHETEYAALCIAGVLDFEDALRLVMLRSKLIQEESQEHLGLSINGLPLTLIEQLCEKASEGDRHPAHQSCFIAERYSGYRCYCGGTALAINTLVNLANQKGRENFGSRWQGLRQPSHTGFVTGPFMLRAQRRFNKEADQYLSKMAPPRCAVYMNAAIHRARH